MMRVLEVPQVLVEKVVEQLNWSLQKQTIIKERKGVAKYY
jgi:hypothetical protein